jgi:HlyD family secretion protein
VKKGQVLARLDPALFKTQVDQAQASVNANEAVLSNDAAAIATTKANLEKARIDVFNTDRKLKLIKQLYEEGLETRNDLDSAQAALDASVACRASVQAQLEAARAGLKADKARLAQAQANLQSAQVNLEHTIITSPISGTVISRNVDRGQTVAASFSTPTMFTIGEDLTKMQVSTNTDEADIGKLKPGMDATFTVDAYPGEVFFGKLSQVRLASTIVQNIVTYNAIISAANPQLKLKPGMTANVKVTVEKVENALKVPNAALRFKPDVSEAQLKTALAKAGEGRYWNLYRSIFLSLKSEVPSTSFSGGSVQQKRGLLWITGADDFILPVIVKLGLMDGSYAQVVSINVREGDRVVTGLDSLPGHETKSQSAGLGGPAMDGSPPPPPP